MFGTDMQSGHSIWMTDLNLMFHFFLKCSLDRLQHLAQNNLAVLHLGSLLRNVRPFLALIRTKASVKTRTFAQTVASMASVVSVGADTERRTTQNAKLLSKLVQEKEELVTAERARVAKEGPRLLEPRGEKRKVEEVLVPKFHHGFAWGDSSSKNTSPAALYTETAPPLPSPPDHLINDPIIQATIKQLGDHIKHPSPNFLDHLGGFSRMAEPT
jgi:hypothetical protein